MKTNMMYNNFISIFDWCMTFSSYVNDYASINSCSQRNIPDKV